MKSIKKSWMVMLVVMMLGLTTGMVMTVQATEEKQFVSFTLEGSDGDETRTGKITYSDNSVDSISFTKWDSTGSLPSAGGNYYLTGNVNLSGEWNVLGNPEAPNDLVETRICLNGHTIIQNVDEPVIYCGVGSKLSLFDCGTSGVITHADNKSGSGIYVTDTAVVSIYGGKIIGNTGNDRSSAGGIFLVGGGTLNLFDGEISGNTGVAADGIYSFANSFNLYGGIVSDNIVVVEGHPINIMADLSNNQYKVKLLKKDTRLTYGEFATGWTQFMGDADPSQYFVPEISGWIVARKENGLAIYKAATGVTIDRRILDLAAGGQMAELTATIAPEDGTNPIVKWSIEGNGVKLYTDLYDDDDMPVELNLDTETTITTVYAKGTTAGEAKITATATNGTASTSDDKTVTCSVTVHETHEHDNCEFEPWMSTTSLPKYGKYYLTADVTLSGPLSISGDSEIRNDLSICLNGHKIIQSTNGSVIVNGTYSELSVFDCGLTGEITHAEGKTGSGITVIGEYSDFFLHGGAITGNNATNGGGVEVCEGGSFYMKGGSVTRNNAGCGGGVYNKGWMEIENNASITGNKAVSGGGIYLEDNNLVVGGKASIMGNTNNSNAPNNVYVKTGRTFKITTGIEPDASIGVTMETPGVFTNGLKVLDYAAIYALFTSDNDEYILTLTDGKAGLAAAHTISFDAETNGGCNNDYDSQRVAEGMTLDLDPDDFYVEKDGWNFLGWNTDPTATTVLEQIKVGTEDKTLYAIFSKDLTGTFYSGSNQTETVSTTIYNLATEGSITAPALKAIDGWTAVGWNTSETAYEGNIAVNASVKLSSDTNYYGIYSKPVTVSYEANGGDSTPASQSGTKYLNVHAEDSYQNPKFTLAAAISKHEYDFEKWHVGSVESATAYEAGQTDVELGEDTTLYAGWVQWSQVAEPIFSPVAGTYLETQSVTITSPTEGADIYYTTNKKTPTTSDTKYTGAISVSTDMTIKAIAVKSRMRDSDVAEAVYAIREPDKTAGTSNFIPEDPTSSLAGLEDTPQDSGRSLSQQLDAIAQQDSTIVGENEAKNVQVSMEASSKQDLTEVDETNLTNEQQVIRNQQIAITNVVDNQIPESDKADAKTDYMELTVNKTVTKFQIDDGNNYTVINSETKELSNVDQVLEIPVKYDMTGHSNLIVTRTHNDQVQVFQRLNARPVVYADGTFYVEGSGRDAVIYIYSAFFSMYSVTKYGPKEQISVTQAPAAKMLTYNGTYQQLVSSGAASKGSMMYVLGTNGTTAPSGGWSKDIPTAREAGTYYVWYKAGGDENYTDSTSKCVVVTINEAKPAATPETIRTDAQPVVSPEPITISTAPKSVKAKAKGKRVTVSWRKIKKNKKGKALLKQIANIEIQYSTDPSFPKETTTTKTVGKKKTKVVLRAQPKTTLFIRLRYRGADGVSNWSATRRVRTK